MPVVLLVLHFPARKDDMSRIDDDDVIPTVSIGTEERFVLPAKDGGDLGGEAADDLGVCGFVCGCVCVCETVRERVDGEGGVMMYVWM